jgi:hypothetical protein
MPHVPAPPRKLIKPITPEQVKNCNHIPEFVIDIFNKLIAAKFSNGVAVVKQDDLVEEIIKPRAHKMTHSRDDVFKNGWLNIETLYESYGWKVEYDKPAYNETYPATFKFTERK